MMSNVCCKEFGAWCKAFTRAERALAAAEAGLLALLVAGLAFLALHLSACDRPPAEAPSRPENKENDAWPDSPSLDYDHLVVEPSDGEAAGDEYEPYFLALAKPSARGEYTFGCVLSAVSKYWALTAASCIEAIEEVDSLDSFVMVQGYGGAREGRRLDVADLRVHPRWAGAGAGAAHDAAALRAHGPLAGDGRAPLRLPSMVDYFSMAVGERLFALGYGEYRMSQGRGRGRGPYPRGLRRAAVFSAGAKACEGSWSLRHLVPLRPLAAGSCGARELCAGPLWRRGDACAHCAGTPLVRPGAPPLLLGVMGASPQCGLDCEPRSYVNVAQLRDWLRTLQ